MKCAWGKLGLFAGGLLFGTAGLKILSSKEAKKAYTYPTAAALRAKEEVMTVVTAVKENAGDILADAKVLNENRAAEKEAEVIAVSYTHLKRFYAPTALREGYATPNP